MDHASEDKYGGAYRRDRPRHDPYDEFSLRHPRMDLGQRAKIFSPFAALKGFEQAIEEKLELYEEKRELNEEEQTCPAGTKITRPTVCAAAMRR